MRDLSAANGGERTVVYVLPNAELGGAERATWMMIRHHDRVRYRPVVFFLNSGPLVDQLRKEGLTVGVLDGALRMRNPAQVFRAWRQLARFVVAVRADLIHSCMAYSHLIASPVAARLGVPIVLFQHGPVTGWQDRIASFLPSRCVMVNSRYTQRKQRNISWRKRPCPIVSLASEFSLADRERILYREQLNARYGLDANIPVVGVLARLEPLKGIHVALEALAPLLRDDRAVLMIVGGSYRHFHRDYGSDLRDWVHRQGIESRVIFAGFQSNPLPYLARMDIVLSASIQEEGLGLSLLEGMSLGKPVVGPRAGGVLDLIDDEDNGLLHQPGSASELRRSVERLLDDVALRVRLGANALRKAASDFSLGKMMGRLESIYDRAFEHAR